MLTWLVLLKISLVPSRESVKKKKEEKNPAYGQWLNLSTYAPIQDNVIINFHVFGLIYICVYQKTVCVCQRQPASVTYSLICHWQFVFVTEDSFLSHTIFICRTQSEFLLDIVCVWVGVKFLSQTVCVYLHTVCFCHRQSISVRDSLCLSQTLCVCNRQ